MDKSEAAYNAIVQINRAKENPAFRPEMISAVCSFFDFMKGKELSHADRLFLHYIANQAGLPHYYNPMLGIGDKVADDISLQTLSNYLKESRLIVGENVSLHNYQKEILDKFSARSSNRYFLSASTSFGKTFLVYEIIRKMHYNNLVLVFPTIALMSENLGKINTDPSYRWVKEYYHVHTLSEINEWGEHNIFIYTPERFLSFLDKNPNRPRMDFVFVDEAYKLDNSFVIDGEEQENERDITYRVALSYLLQDTTIDCLLAAPYVESLSNIQDRPNDSFAIFLQVQGISILDYNKYEIVGKTTYQAVRRKKLALEEDFEINLEVTGKQKRFVSIVSQIVNHHENLIAYAYSRTSAESYAKLLIDSADIHPVDTRPFADFLRHLERSMGGHGRDWVVTKGLRKGVGVHHGLVPKYIQNEIIRLFNQSCLHTLICTTTITEGVNTTAKNMVILSNMKGSKMLKKFDAMNIEGRAGRFLKHYNGRVIVLEDKFNDVMNMPNENLHHKYYDVAAIKNDVDLMFVNDRRYLNDHDTARKQEIDVMLETKPIHDLIRNSFATIPIPDKIDLYERYIHLAYNERLVIDNFVSTYYLRRWYSAEGFDRICSLILPIVRKGKMHELITVKVNDDLSLLSILVSYYLKEGLQGSVIYNAKRHPIDQAVRESTQFVFNTLKYEVVKYVGLFNLVYHVVQMEQRGVQYEETIGLDYLLSRFEFNADTMQGRIVSDLGAPQRVVEYFDNVVDNPRKADRINKEMDAYELQLTAAISEIINNGE